MEGFNKMTEENKPTYTFIGDSKTEYVDGLHLTQGGDEEYGAHIAQAFTMPSLRERIASLLYRLADAIATLARRIDK